MKVIDVIEGTIDLGHSGEHLATQIRFPIASLISEYGEGIFLLLVKRPGDSISYPVRTYHDDEYLYWNVTGVDTIFPGTGRCELQYFVAESLVKSIVYVTIIGESAWSQLKPEERWHYNPYGPHAPKPYPPMPPGPPKSKRGYYSEYEYLPPELRPQHSQYYREMVSHDPAYNKYNQGWNDPSMSWFNDAIIQGVMAQKAAQEAAQAGETAAQSQEDSTTAAQLAQQYCADSERYRDAALLAQLIVKSAQADILQAKQDVESMMSGVPTISFKGAYDAATEYKMNDIVVVDNTSYWHIGTEATTGIDTSDTTVWMQFLDGYHA